MVNAKARHLVTPVLTGLAWLLGPGAAWADAGTAVRRADWWLAWDWDPVILLNLGLLSYLYFLGTWRFLRRAKADKGMSRWHAASFITTILLLCLALLSPVDVLAADLSWVHMVQHMLIATAAAPLFVLASPGRAIACGVPRRVRVWLNRYSLPRGVLRHPLLVWPLHALALWTWHHPAFYQAALNDPLVHDAQHLCFFAASWLYWRILIDPVRRNRLAAPMAVPMLFATALHASLLGIFLALSPQPWYEHYEGRTIAWGLTTLADQQLAGLIMWVPACLIYPVAAATLFGCWLADLSAGTWIKQQART